MADRYELRPADPVDAPPPAAPTDAPPPAPPADAVPPKPAMSGPRSVVGALLLLFLPALTIWVTSGFTHACRAEPGPAVWKLAVYAVVNSITTNFPAVARVQILVEDRPAVTLAGHVDLSRPLPPDMTLLAAVDAAPAAGAPGPGGTSPGAPATAPSPAS